jgi:hypothetical protein
MAGSPRTTCPLARPYGDSGLDRRADIKTDAVEADLINHGGREFIGGGEGVLNFAWKWVREREQAPCSYHGDVSNYGEVSALPDRQASLERRRRQP